MGNCAYFAVLQLIRLWFKKRFLLCASTKIQFQSASDSMEVLDNDDDSDRGNWGDSVRNGARSDSRVIGHGNGPADNVGEVVWRHGDVGGNSIDILLLGWFFGCTLRQRGRLFELAGQLIHLSFSRILLGNIRLIFWAIYKVYWIATQDRLRRRHQHHRAHGHAAQTQPHLHQLLHLVVRIRVGGDGDRFGDNVCVCALRQWDIVISAVCCGVWHMPSLGDASVAIWCSCCSKLTLFEDARCS